MSAHSGIEWTDATWNPVTGCTKVSEGCRHCYAETWAKRHLGEFSKDLSRKFSDVRVHEEKLTIPLRWQKPQRVFVNSMSDLFHEYVEDAFIDQVFAVMALAPQHTFQILTKRPERMRDYVNGAGLVGDISGRSWRIREAGHALGVKIGDEVNFALPLRNVWLGTSVEDQAAADKRVPLLLETPARVRFLSCEPLLGPVDLRPYLRPRICGQCGGKWNEHACGPTHAMLAADAGLHWIIAGGESGPGARPCNIDWLHALVADCNWRNVALFVKQLGARPCFTNPGEPAGASAVVLRDRKGGDWSEWPEELRVREFPKTA